MYFQNSVIQWNFLFSYFQGESEVAQPCLTLFDPVDCNQPGSPVPGILQARTLEWVAISFSRESSELRDRTQVSRIAGRLFNLWATRADSSFKVVLDINAHQDPETPQTAANQAPPSLGFSRQEHWNGLPFPSQCMKVKSESEVAQSCLTLHDPMDCSYQAPPPMGFSRQEYWSGVPSPSPWKYWSTIYKRTKFEHFLHHIQI